jgi:hypothetical protein
MFEDDKYYGERDILVVVRFFVLRKLNVRVLFVRMAV